MRKHNVTKVTLSGITLMNMRCFTIIPGQSYRSGIAWLLKEQSSIPPE
ncbi:hypothetical protein SN04_02702 [Serratia marcescens]|nr:hypothetical protein SN04_02702 [Serratia marcescens]